ncbi:hypothetical protein BJI69_00295 [Luteibacter rhizovicinus DSM 16549]|uniref:Uncharacterized protein n=1 Tax=Luteibacter rhizovicinus DSM 16549 TaxID=1440763 RepID=A0A0G9HCE0_9GAMM|nr:hypothetical protein [Luteibacter rhizovicinus]APG02492.1 hypothetical protein BJI69_00295 [Luteibacter rhizovicinus DSM 16549]KLD67293.1 hypothetical protein Y883_08580 [Luteibacter rhizovicinus DSM 16549]KLD74742.1 hypothetical protein Y886_30950 [Xanthomonas hyacinthi DSM 19077]
MHRLALGLTLVLATTAATPASATASEDLGPRVDRLVEDTTKDSASESRAFDVLLKLGNDGVPYIISHLGDGRRLPEQSIIIRRLGREDRQVKPWYVHDGLEFVLTELTGFSMGPQNGHLLKSEREQHTRKWVAWCVDKFPAQMDICRSVHR